jgi:hypothetical protein
MMDRWWLSLLTLLSCGAVHPHEEPQEIIEELVVYGRSEQRIGTAISASEGVVGYDDIRLPPLLRAGELVEVIPGMVATQHSGTGKANQYFLRGFNLDHGTDFFAAAAGVPINLRSHGHCQGYLDLNYLIPELVATTTYRKGPYRASAGDFSSAGNVEFQFYDRLDESQLHVAIGEDGYYRGLLASSLDAGGGILTGAFDATSYQGPWAVQAGLIDERGFLDPDLGGDTERFSLSGTIDFQSWHVTAYAVDYDFTLFSNFTYLLQDPVNGDEFEQRDKRKVYGAHTNGEHVFPFVDAPVTWRWGAGMQYDDIDEVGLYRTAARQRLESVRRDRIEELSLDARMELEFALTDQLRVIGGVRGDYYDFDVDARREENSGDGDDFLLSPKITMAYRLQDELEFYANWGKGFHSNDVRGVVIRVDPVTGEPVQDTDLLIESEGAELGTRLELGPDFNLSLVGFWLDLDSELVFVGDAGGTEPNDGSRRLGLETSLFWRATDWLAINADYTYTDAEFRTDQAGGKSIPGAVESTFTLGLNAAWRSGLVASMRVRYLGEAPLIEDNTIQSDDSLLVNFSVAYRRGAIELALEGFNLLDSNDDDISYFYSSRLPGEPPEGIEDIHFHPLEPRTMRGSVTVHW